MTTEIQRYEPQEFPLSTLEAMAGHIARSGLFGVKKPEEAIALMLVAQAEGRHPATVARDYDIIQGRPSKKSEAMLRDFQASGGSVEWKDLTDKKCSAIFRHPQGGEAMIDWTIERAITAGLGNKPMWKSYPRQMLRSRTISEGVRTVFPGATSGVYSPEEVTDIGEDDAPPVSRMDTAKRIANEAKSKSNGNVIDAETVDPPHKDDVPETEIEGDDAEDAMNMEKDAPPEKESETAADDDTRTPKELKIARINEMREFAIATHGFSPDDATAAVQAVLKAYEKKSDDLLDDGTFATMFNAMKKKSKTALEAWVKKFVAAPATSK